MQSESSIFIVVAIERPEPLQRVLNLLVHDKLPSAPAPFTSVRVEQCPLVAIDERIRRRRRSSRNAGIVLISDGLADEADFQPHCTSAARDLLDGFGDSLLTMIAVMDHPTRVTDIDRSISLRPRATEFSDSLDRCLRKLAYLRKPSVQQEKHAVHYEFRVLRYEHELLAYFRFRHDVYSVMCYLDADAERAPSGMEIDWFDKAALHLGVYHHRRGQEQLVGTGRLVASEAIAGAVPEKVALLAQQDAILRGVLSHAIQLKLPVLQSHDFVDIVNRLYDKRVVAGEISRVTVAPEHRGLGLSVRITEHLIRLARQAGLADILLECLPIHTDIYRKCGFAVIKNAAGRVYRIGRTMEVMGLPLGKQSVLSSRLQTKTPA